MTEKFQDILNNFTQYHQVGSDFFNKLTASSRNKHRYIQTAEMNSWLTACSESSRLWDVSGVILLSEYTHYRWTATSFIGDSRVEA